MKSPLFIALCALMTPMLNGQTTLVFQDGVEGYSGTRDTYIRSAGATTSYGTAADISVDGDDGSPGLQPNHGLIRFEDIIGVGGIPAGSTITSATLRLLITNPGSGMTVHRMLATWSESSTWNSLTGGVTANGTEAEITPLASFGANNGSENVPNGTLDINITAAVQAWADGAGNFGIALLPFTNGTNGIDFPTREAATVSQRPQLTVTFTPPGDPPTVSLTAPTSAATFDAPASITLAADASDTDGTIDRVEFFANGVEIGDVDTAPYEFTWSGVASGNYSLTAIATDNLGVTATSAAVAISVTNLDNSAPTVSISSPVNGSVTVLDPIVIEATALDADGFVAKVEFFDGTTLLGEDTTAPFSFSWSSAPNGSRTLTAVATDNDGAATTSAPVAITISDPVLTTAIAKESVWKYLDNGSDQGTAWRENSFDDSTWASGPGILGGGDTHIDTTVNLGPDGNRFITTYFRRTFDIADPSLVQALRLNILRDDGVVVYINGTEVARQNMPAGPVNYLTDTPDIVSGSAETTYFPATASPFPTLVAGQNLIAVEVHQRDGNSSDLGFDLELIAESFSGNLPPIVTPTSPANLAEVPVPAVDLTVSLDDPEDQPLTVTFYGREKGSTPGPDFTLVTIPDTQFYSETAGRFPQFLSQTNWIVSSKAALNTAFVAHMGDMAQSYDTIEAEYVRADQAMDIIEDPATTFLTHGIPWGGAPGNHDIGQGTGTTNFWNQYFGTSRWAGRPYFGGNFGTNNNNNYQFFSASGLDFIVINLAYNSSTAGNQAIMDWADALLKANPNRRGIITSHWLIGTGNPASFGGHGQAVLNNLKDNPNLFLMLCGHIHGEGRRQDVADDGHIINTVLQDYQSRANGGDSWLRYFIFSPANNTISARTYRTLSGEFETDADSQFDLAYDMTTGNPWVEVGTVVTSGSSATASFTGLEDGVEYEWYAAASDGVNAVSTAPQSFTAIAAPAEITITASDDTAGEFGADQALEFAVARSGPTTDALTVSLAASGSATAADYSGFTASVEIPAASASVTLPITVLPDALAEGTETLTVSVVPDAAYTLGTPATADATIADKPAQGFYFANIADAAKRGTGDDADGDGIANVIEYFMGTLPDNGASRNALEIVPGAEGEFTVTFSHSKNAPDADGKLQWSLNLSDWYDGGDSDGTLTVNLPGVVTSPPAQDPETITVSGTITGGSAPRIYVRLAVE